MKNQYKNQFQIFYFTLILLLISTLSYSQNIVLKGEIYDQNGNPVKTAFIKKRGTKLATISNKNGEFNFTISNSDSVLVISKKGYYDKEIYLKGEKSITIELIQIDNSYFKNDEYQTMGGFGQWKDANSSSSISHFILEKYHHSNKNLLDILETVPGLVVKSKSGQPGASASVLSRGYESVISNQPLIIIDGVTINTGINMPDIAAGISPLATMNVKDVIRIEVLRDAASTAMFGSRGANGVIVIETNRGTKSPFEVKNHTQFGVSFSLPGDNPMEPVPYFDLINESLTAASINPLIFPENPTAKNWQDEISRPGIVANHTLSFQGGGEKSQFYLSGNINHTTGILQKSNLLNGGVRFNSFHTISKWLAFSININYSEARQESPGHSENEMSANPTTYARAYPPLPKNEFQEIPELWNLYGGLDPLELINQQKAENKSSFLLGGVGMKIKFSNRLTFHSKVSGDYSYYTKKTLMLYPVNPNRGEPLKLESNRETSLYNWEFNNYLKYQQLEGSSNWLLLLGSNEYYLNTSDLFQSNLSKYISPSPTLLAAEGRNSRRVSALYAKLHYAYNERFDLSANFRREKILNQEGVDQFGLFPSFSSGVWLKKMEGNEDALFSGMKIFLGWGVPGANRFYAINYFKNNLNEQFSANPSQTGMPKFDPNARWEVTEEWNIGLRTVWFNGDLDFKVTYFDRMRDNVAYLTTENIDDTVSPKWNYTGRVFNSGYELELYYKKSFKKFGLFGGFNMQINSSKVLTLGESNSGKTGYYPQYANREIPITVFREGNAPGAFWGFINEGVVGREVINWADKESVKSGVYAGGNPERGDYRFKDLDNNGIIDENDMTVIGNPAPATTYSINGGVIFDKFDMTFVLDGTSGGDILNLNKTVSESTGGYNNRSARMNGRWSETNTTGNLARVQYLDPNNNNRVHSGMVEKGSYFRFNKIEVGYNFNFKNEKKNRVYLSTHNLVTFSTYTDGAPLFIGINNNRGVDFGTYPFHSTVLIGLQLGI